MSSLNPVVKLSIGGQELKMRYDGNALAAYEAETGKNLFTESIGDTLNVSTTTALVWAGLSTFHPALTLRDFRALIGHGDMPAILQAFTEAWGIAKPEPPEAEDPANPTAE